jgi:ribose 5-phosphate isomerase B
MKIYLGADHGGYKLKEEMKDWLKEWGFEFEDLGAFSFIPEDDYPDYAWAVGQKVGTTQGSLGILVCRSGQGACIVANKCRHSRAATAWNERSAQAARHDDDANILCLPADYLTVDLAKKVVQVFLHTKFDAQDHRFTRRLQKVKKIDQNL